MSIAITELSAFDPNTNTVTSADSLYIAVKSNTSANNVTHTYNPMQVNADFFVTCGKEDQEIKGLKKFVTSTANIPRTVTPTTSSDISSVINIEWVQRPVDKTLLYGYDVTGNPACINSKYGYPCLDTSEGIAKIYLDEDFNDYEKIDFVFTNAYGVLDCQRHVTIDTAQLSNDIRNAINIGASLSGLNSGVYYKHTAIQYPVGYNSTLDLTCYSRPNIQITYKDQQTINVNGRYALSSTDNITNFIKFGSNNAMYWLSTNKATVVPSISSCIMATEKSFIVGRTGGDADLAAIYGINKKPNTNIGR